jgi:serine protease Do
MMKRNLLVAVGIAALGISLIALPAHTTPAQSPQENSVASLKREIAELKARLAATQDEQEFSGPIVSEAPEVGPEVEIERQLIDIQEPEGPVAPPTPSARRLVMSLDGEGGSWLGVETQEVTPEKAKSLKLSPEHGALIGKVLPDSPASKAGLKENDVVTEINGQRVEGTTQFRRMIRETPGGRAVQLSVWRDGKQQTITATLGKSEERHGAMMKVSPQAFAFRIPEMPTMPEIPEIHNFGWDSGMSLSGKPRLGIDAENLTGQLGAYFGVPEGEGVLVRNVNTDSPAEKAGVKAGDVITTFNGERIRTAGELREKLAGIEGGKSVTLGVLRNKSDVKLTVELPAPAPKEKRKVTFRTNI